MYPPPAVIGPLPPSPPTPQSPGPERAGAFSLGVPAIAVLAHLARPPGAHHPRRIPRRPWLAPDPTESPSCLIDSPSCRP